MAAAKKSAARPWANYSVFGLSLRSNFPIRSWLSTRSDWDLSFQCRCNVPAEEGRWKKTRPLYTSPYHGPDKKPVFYLYKDRRGHIFHYPGTVDFLVRPDQIVAHLRDPEAKHRVEIHLLGAVLPWCLEQLGVMAFHASAVALEPGIIAFMGSHGRGKSTLAAAFLKRGGQLVADDILAVEEVNGEFQGRPGYPQLRLWPDTAQELIGSADGLERIDPQWEKLRVAIDESEGSFCRATRPISRIYLADRDDSATAPSIGPIRKRDGVIELLRNSFLARLIPAMGREEKRLDQLTALANSVPVRRLRYPGGFERLDEVVETVVGDRGV